MLALHEKELKYSRSTVPPVEVFRKWGPMMPAISINGESWFLESKEILHRLGYSPVTEEDMEHIRKAWTGVMHRADYWPRFWGEFSLASDPNPKFVVRFIKNFFRAFTIMYFFTLIRSGVLIRGYRDPGCHADAYLTWEKRLAQENSPFLGGEIPDANDLLLFGIVQCHCSIPVPTVLELQTDTRLSFTRKWIGRMQSRFANYESLYSATYFPPLCRSRASNRYGAVCILVGEPLLDRVLSHHPSCNRVFYSSEPVFTGILKTHKPKETAGGHRASANNIRFLYRATKKQYSGSNHLSQNSA